MSQAGALNGGGGGGGGTADIQKINVQTGTSPVVTANNTITFNGVVVAAGTNPVRTDGTAPATMALEVQTAQAIASTDATKIGLAAFNSADFTVDANGFVSSAGGGSGITTIDGDTGSVTGSTVTIFANNAANNCGATVKFVNSGTTSTLNVTDTANNNTLIGEDCGNATPGTAHTCLGQFAGFNMGAVNANTFLGYAAGFSQAHGNRCTFIGKESGINTTASNDSIFIGNQSGVNHGGSDSSNIIIGNSGTGGDNNLIRIGIQGSGNAQQDKCFIAGIIGATTVGTNGPQVVLCDNSGQLTTVPTLTAGFVLTSNGATTPTFQAAGGGSVTIAGDSGSISGSSLTIFANTATQNSGSSVSFSNSGTTSTLNLSDANLNTILGNGSGTAVGAGNTGVGILSGALGNASFLGNTWLGHHCLTAGTSANANIAIGANSLFNLVSGSTNICIGGLSGQQYTGSESSNICIYNVGSNGESNAIHIGDFATHTSCTLAGVAGVTVANTNMVTIDTTTGQLGSQAVTTGGTVTNVSGTANQVAVATGTTTPVISLIGPYTPASYTPYAVLTGGTTSTGSIQSIASVGTSGDVLTSNGAGALPTFQPSSGGTGAAKAWGIFTVAVGGSVTGVPGSFNVTSVVVSGVVYVVTLTTPFSSSAFATIAMAGTGGSTLVPSAAPLSTSTFQIAFNNGLYNVGGVVSFVCFGV